MSLINSSTVEKLGDEFKPNPPQQIHGLIRQKTSTITGFCGICQSAICEDDDLRLGCKCLIHYKCLVDYIHHELGNDRKVIEDHEGIPCPNGKSCAFFLSDPYFMKINDLQIILKYGVELEQKLKEVYSLEGIPSLDKLPDRPLLKREISKMRQWLELKNQNDPEIGFEKSQDDFICLTSKACPKCGFRESHPHGHHCHHVKSGCFKCKTEYCYSCGSTAEENIKIRGQRSNCACERKSWSTFCSSSDILSNISFETGYPCDSRCGCHICSECAPGRPCGTCSGVCVVCTGLICQGPSEVSEVKDWTPQNEVIKQRVEKEKSLQVISLCIQSGIDTFFSQLLDTLENNGFGFNYVDITGSTFLIDASRYGRVSMVKMLLARGARANFQRSDGFCAITIAAMYGHLSVVDAIVQHNPDSLYTENALGDTLLMIAIQYHHSELAKYLIEKGCDINKPNHDSTTPMMIASFVGDLKTAEILMSNKKLLLNVVDKNLFDALRYALIGANQLNGRHAEIVKLLLNAGVNYLAVINGLSAKDIAIKNMSTKDIKLIFQNKIAEREQKQLKLTIFGGIFITVIILSWYYYTYNNITLLEKVNDLYGENTEEIRNILSGTKSYVIYCANRKGLSVEAYNLTYLQNNALYFSITISNVGMKPPKTITFLSSMSKTLPFAAIDCTQNIGSETFMHKYNLSSDLNPIVFVYSPWKAMPVQFTQQSLLYKDYAISQLNSALSMKANQAATTEELHKICSSHVRRKTCFVLEKDKSFSGEIETQLISLYSLKHTFVSIDAEYNTLSISDPNKRLDRYVHFQLYALRKKNTIYLSMPYYPSLRRDITNSNLANHAMRFIKEAEKLPDSSFNTTGTVGDSESDHDAFHIKVIKRSKYATYAQHHDDLKQHSNHANKLHNSDSNDNHHENAKKNVKSNKKSDKSANEL
eukprot:gene10837-14548_t